MATSISGSQSGDWGRKGFRRSLKSPDEFLAALKRAGDAAAKNGKLVAAIAGLVLVAAAVAAYVASQRAERASEARNALYLAQKAEETELKAVASAMAPASKAKPAAPKAPNAKAAPEAPAQADPATVAYARFDVDAKLADTVKKYQSVIKDFDGTRAAFEARLALGALYLNHGEAPKATPWFEQAVNAAPNANERSFALNALGHAQESAGKFTEAHASYERALNQGVEGMKGELLLSMARAQLGAGDPAKARALYDRVISELPESDDARTAEQLKTQLP